MPLPRLPTQTPLPSPRTPRRTLGAGLLCILLIALTPAHAQENTQESPNSERWVSDSLNTYVRSGPTDRYRIVGTLTSGDKVELLATEGDYSQVRTESDSTVWIPSRDLQEDPGQAERLPQLEQQVAKLSQQLATINESWQTRVQGMQETLESRRAQIDELEARRQTLDAQLTEALSELRSAQARLDDESREVLMRYMVYGGGIAGGGLLVGLILPLMFRGRKRNDRWF